MKFNENFIRSQNQTKYTRHYGKLIKKNNKYESYFHVSCAQLFICYLGSMLPNKILEFWILRFYTICKCFFIVFKPVFECNRAECITENFMFSVLQSFNTLKRNKFTNKSVSVFRTACKKPVVDVRSHWTLSGQPQRRTSTQRACTLNVWPFWKFK